MCGGDLLTLKEILGHSSMRMVERYAHLASAHKRKQVNYLNSIFTNEQIDTNQSEKFILSTYLLALT